MKTEPCGYNIVIRRVLLDGDPLFEATVRELPDVAEYAETADSAYALALDTIETTRALFLESGRPMPRPFISEKEFSGRVTLRVPRSLHRALSEAAQDEAVSLNQFLVSVLERFSGYCYARTRSENPWSLDAAPTAEIGR